jgi:hypothetical protein
MDPVQTFQLAVLTSIGLLTAVFGWLHSKRIGVAAAEKAAREAHKDVIEAQIAHISAVKGRLRLLEDTIEADKRTDAHQDQELSECIEERDRERQLYEAAIEQFEWLQAAVWAEDATEPAAAEGLRD